jgi:hypothetical protein
MKIGRLIGAHAQSQPPSAIVPRARVQKGFLEQ